MSVTSLGSPERAGRNHPLYRTVEDVHARKLADMAVRQSEAFATSILESTPDCVEVVDLGGRLQFMNWSGYKMMEGYGRKPPPGQDWVALWPDDVQPQVREAMAMAARGAVTRFGYMGPIVDKVPSF